MTLNKLRYDLYETSTLLCVSVRTIVRRIESGKLLGAYKDGKKWYVPSESIIEYNEQLKNF